MTVSLGRQGRRKEGGTPASVGHAMNVVCAKFVAMVGNRVNHVGILKDVSQTILSRASMEI